MTTRACIINGVTGIFTLIIVLGGLATGTAVAWEPQSNWQDIGTVRGWVALDAKFYRIHEESLYLNESHQKTNQVKEYEKTREYRGRLEGIGTDLWQTLSADEQKERRKLAQRELKFVADFRNRILNQVQNTRLELRSGWGEQITDHTVVGDILTKLRTAVALDPSNPYAWHLYSYFSTLVGDETRALLAIAGAENALALIPETEELELRAGVALDKAWLLRSQGLFDEAMASLEVVRAAGTKNVESLLVQGLLAAQTGDDQTAITIAVELRGTKVGSFPMNTRSASFSPDLANVDAWKMKPSSYLHDWIMAYTWLREGKMDLAGSAFGAHRLNDQRPFAKRFWNEAASFYEVTGRYSMAQNAWVQARVTTPYYPYMVSKDYTERLGNLTGRPGKIPYLLGFDSHFLSGSRLAFCAALVNEMATATEQDQKLMLATRALDQLEIIERFGVYTGQASVLQGQVYYLMGDLSSALVEIEQALEHLQKTGDMVAYKAVLAQLSVVDHDLAPQDIANFYGQSGTSRSRWRTDADPDAALAALRAEYAADDNDLNRQNLARFLIRSDELAEGRELARASLDGAKVTEQNVSQLAGKDVELLLEAERNAGGKELATYLVATLKSGEFNPWYEAGVWTLVGFICLDHELNADGKLALERASALDPGNQGLKIQLSLM